MAAKLGKDSKDDDNSKNKTLEPNTSSSEQTSDEANKEPQKLDAVIDIPPEQRNKTAGSYEQRCSGNEYEGILKKVPIESLQLPCFCPESKIQPEIEECEETDIEQTKDETLASTKEGCKRRRHIGKKILKVLANLFSKKKRSDDVELGDEEPVTSEVTQKDEDCVDKAKPQEADRVSILEKSIRRDIKKAKKVKKTGPSILEIMLQSLYAALALVITATIVFSVFIGIILLREYIETAPLRDGRYVEVVTGCGMVEGVKEGDVFAFRGIPYAQSPVGELRWRAARQIQSIEDCWDGTLQTHNSSIVCSQLSSSGEFVGQEDCLYLDIVTPRVCYNNLRPVVVLIGADTLNGPSPGILQAPLHNAHKHGVVFVRPNFRLGAFGFLSVEALTKDAYPRTSGNYGLTDILAVLKWVQLNICHFGGDAKSVTLLGYRAGGTLVSALLSSKEAEGLFARAWTSSSAAIFPGKPLQESEKLNQEIMHAIDCDTVACLRTAPPKQIWAATPDAWLHAPGDLPTRTESFVRRHEWLVLDGSILQHNPSDFWKKDRTGSPSLVMGTTAHASHTAKLREQHLYWSAKDVRDFISSSHLGFLNLTEDIMKLYRVNNYNDLISIITDIRTICPLLINARQQPSVPFYVVTHRNVDDGLVMVDADMQAILGHYSAHRSYDRDFAESMEKYFYDYVKYGTVPSFEPRRQAINVGCQALTSIFENFDHCDFWISKDIVPRYARID